MDTWRPDWRLVPQLIDVFRHVVQILIECENIYIIDYIGHRNRTLKASKNKRIMWNWRMSQITRLFPPGLLLLMVKVWGYLSLSRSWGGVISYWHAPTQQRRVCGGAWLQHGSSRRQVPPQQTTAPQQQHHSSTTADTGGAAKQSPDRCKHWYWYPLRFKDSTIDPQEKCNIVVGCCCCRC